MATLPEHVRAEVSWPEGGLRLGDRGITVRRMQEWLCYHGYNCAIDGDFGPATRECVTRFQIGRSIAKQVGDANRATLGELSNPLLCAFIARPMLPKGTLREAVLFVASRHYDARPREFGGDNRGMWVRVYCGGKDGPEYKWCAGSALTIQEQAAMLVGIAAPIAFTLGCDELARDAKEKGRLTHDPSRARPGDLFVCYRATSGGGKDYYHTGICAGLRPSTMQTYEGNTNDDGSANGYEFTTRTRNLVGKDYVLLG